MGNRLLNSIFLWLHNAFRELHVYIVFQMPYKLIFYISQSSVLSWKRNEKVLFCTTSAFYVLQVSVNFMYFSPFLSDK